MGSRRKAVALTIAAFALLSAACLTVNWLLQDFGVEAPAPQPKSVARAPSALTVTRAPKQAKAQPEPRRPPLTGIDNILIAGMDRRPGAKGSGLTDTLIVVVMKKRTGEVGLISVPRDLAVEVPDHGLDRINTVYGMALSHGKNGLSALKESVGELLGLPIKHAVVVDLAMFERLIDTLGGVTVDVACPIIDDFVDSRTADGRRVLDVKAGQVRMDGATAAMYVRSRHGRSDFSRARRQQSVLNAIHRELLSLGTLGQLPEVLETVERGVSTDLKRYQLLQLATRALMTKRDMIHAIVISEKDVEPLWDRGRAMLSPKPGAIDRAVSKLFSARPPGAERPDTVCAPADIALRRKNHAKSADNADGKTGRLGSDTKVKVVVNDNHSVTVGL